MHSELIKREFFVHPGYLCVPKKPTLMYAVVGSGIVVTLYDAQKKCGGMSHFVKPHRLQKTDNTPDFAFPATPGRPMTTIFSGVRPRHHRSLPDLSTTTTT